MILGQVIPLSGQVMKKFQFLTISKNFFFFLRPEFVVVVHSTDDNDNETTEEFRNLSINVEINFICGAKFVCNKGRRRSL